MSSTLKDGRSWAEHLGGTKVRFHHLCGHDSVKDYSKGAVAKRMQENGVKLMVRWWGKDRGGVVAPCPKCSKQR